ncbi:DUF2480 family protein [Tenacibaculum caenipelagi]|uniref:Uncharacterized protein DUF2480 n=1 Tax=Tenacibaculum caenipelagi TaxID=1325435 RepID=A0A4R6TGP9_9FLAO|nr:DUF2480 family protein [Tenacibaculum caenipelagi]TDQ28370.1 uncharacterized protein DUF2480 [Tenacibaculum caenipelagi]
MAEEIINRIANSNLITIDLEDFYPKGNRIVFDIKDWLFEGLILREKDFRESVKNHDWSQYQDNYVALTCSSDAIIPSWAYLLLTVELSAFAKKIVVGDLTLLETVIYQDIINLINTSDYKDKPVIIKGCANKQIPSSAYTLLIEKIKPVAKTIMFGEACSTVPLYKRKK